MLPNQSTGFTPFLCNYGSEPITPIQLLKGDEEIRAESIGSFIRRFTSDWQLARDYFKRSVDLQAKYYNRKYRDVEFVVGELVPLSTRNLRMKGIPENLKKRYIGPFKIEEKIGQQAYRLALPDIWKIHAAFHISLVKRWYTVDLQEDQEISSDDVLEIEEPYYEIERILQWRKVKSGRRIVKEYLVLWKGYPIIEASWMQKEQFLHPNQL